jgi:hypothetical protein
VPNAMRGSASDEPVIKVEDVARTFVIGDV